MIEKMFLIFIFLNSKHSKSHLSHNKKIEIKHFILVMYETLPISIISK